MEKYFIFPQELYSMLKEKGVEYLYHSNTASTALTFIKNDALLSRKYVEANGLIQSPQKSDEKDKKVDVWDDVFLDGTDHHKKYRTPNFYGPILFAMKLDLLLYPSLPKILITKDNPMFWQEEQPNDERYYSNIKDVSSDYLTNKRIDARIMFTIRSPQSLIKLSFFCEFIGIDKPKIIVP